MRQVMWRVEGTASDPEPSLSDGFARIAARSDFFDPTRPVLVARAPGRIDLMGGIGDYSGSLVLELPIAAATWVAAQPIADPVFVVESAGAGDLSADTTVTIPLADLVPPCGPLPYVDARALLTSDARRAWAAYVAGAVVVLHRECGRPLRHGVKMLVHSDVPTGKGLSSSAALEVAALEVLTVLTGATLGDRELALLAQKVENHVVGAPCGVMDQMTAVSGRRDHLVEILCQPAELRGHVPVPPGLEVFGIDSGIRHAVSGADYGSVRVAAFMGYRIIADAMGLGARPVAPGRVSIDDARFGGYLANVTPAEWQSRFRDVVPVQLAGRAFLDRYQGTTDAATTVDPDRNYAPRVCTEHPIDEHVRVRSFRDLLQTGAADEESCVRLGALMYQAHASFSACGLGSDGTDRLVDLVRDAGADVGLYGAKITGGGSGGTVAVLARVGSGPALATIAARYRAETDRPAAIFSGSSSGSRTFGVQRLLPV